jgi:hypothetical protein
MIQEGAAVELFHNLAVEARTALATKNFRALVLRLNARERRHVRFVRRLRPLMTVMPIAEYRRQVDFVVLVSRLILKREWEVTKRQGSRGWGKGLAKFASRHRRKWHKPRGWQWVYALLAKDQA